MDNSAAVKKAGESGLVYEALSRKKKSLLKIRGIRRECLAAKKRIRPSGRRERRAGITENKDTPGKALQSGLRGTVEHDAEHETKIIHIDRRCKKGKLNIYMEIVI